MARSAREFNYLTAEYEMKWGAIEATRGSNDFRAGDAIVSFARGQGMDVKGHALLWHQSLPGWVGGLSASDLRAAVAAHIREVAGHFRGRVHAWDVVNEGVSDDGTGLRDTVFRQKLGDGYIAEAFRLAREADPGALLFYNDYGGEGVGRQSRTASTTSCEASSPTASRSTGSACRCTCRRTTGRATAASPRTCSVSPAWAWSCTSARWT